LCFIFGIAICSELPFQCPYKVPDDGRKPSSTGDGGGGLFPELNEDGGLDANTSDTYAQYRASLSLVPCDARPISVYTTPLINADYTVSVVFVYDKPVEDLKKWLE
jgi:hypothetical protein